MKILLLDDHPLFREGLALLLHRLCSDLQLLQASTCDEAFALCEAQPDIELVLLDLGLVGMRGMDGLAVLRARFAQMPVVVVSSADSPALIRQAIDAGAVGFIPKSSSSEILLNALRLVLAKGIYLPPNVLLAEPPPQPLGRAPQSAAASAAASQGSPLDPHQLGLTPRQAEVLYLVLQGQPVKLICRELGLGEGTVKGHVSAVLRALNVTTRTQAVVAAHRLGLRFEPSGDAPAVTRGGPPPLSTASARCRRSASACTGLGSIVAPPSSRTFASSVPAHSPLTSKAGMSAPSSARSARIASAPVWCGCSR